MGRGFGGLGSRAALAWGRFRGSNGGHLGICLGGTCGSGRHIQGRGCNLLGMVGFSFDTQNGGVDILELFGECQLGQEVGGGGKDRLRGQHCGPARLGRRLVGQGPSARL